MHFDIYDFDGIGKVDAYLLGDLVRSLDLRPTQTAIEKAGGTKKKGEHTKQLHVSSFGHRLIFLMSLLPSTGEKILTLEEFLPIYSQLKKDKDCGAYEDLAEGMKVYDKNENGTMMAGELVHVMLMLGEKLTDEQVEDIVKTCAGQEDEDGYIRYDEFLKKVLAGPYPEEAAA